MTTNEAPPRVFEQVYSIIVWSSAAGMAAILSWIIWTLVVHSPSGTKRSSDFERSLATRTALAVLVPIPADQPLTSLPKQCQACHAVSDVGPTICPNLSEVGARAPLRIEEAGYTGDAATAKEYILESIQNPSAYVVDGFKDGIMPKNGGLADPSAAYLDQIADYLLTLN